MLKRYIFGLPDDSPITYHKLGKVSVTAIDNFEAVKAKAALINPYHHKDTNYHNSIYSKLCRELKARGYTIFTNNIAEQQPLPGTLPLRCGLEEFYSIACEVPLIVSVRSGILDLLIPSGINMFVIYDGQNDKQGNPFPLSEWQAASKIREVFMTDDYENDTVSIPTEFVKFLDELKAEGRIP